MIFLLGVAGMVATMRIPDYYRWAWIVVWGISLILLGMGIVRARRPNAEPIEKQYESEPARRIAKIADLVTKSPPDKIQELLAEEHQVDQAYWDTYLRDYVVECTCGTNFVGESLEICGIRMDEHHNAFVRFVAGLREVHALGFGPLPEGGLEGPARRLGEIGSRMDSDWALLSKEQRREASLLSAEIAWRLTAGRGGQEPCSDSGVQSTERTVVVEPTYMSEDVTKVS